MSLLSYILPKKRANGSWFYSIGGSKSNSFADIDNLVQFMEIPELNAVINWKASAFRNARFSLVNENGEVIEDDVSLLSSPNYFQAQGEFLRQTKLFHEIFGNEYLYMLSGLSNKEIGNIRGIFTLPPQLMTMKLSKSDRFWLERKMPELIYLIRWGGNKIPIKAKDIIHLNDNRVDITGTKEAVARGESFLGESKIQGLKPALNNIRAAYIARGTNLTESGPRGILSNANSDGMGATIPIDDKEKTNLQEEMKGYGTQEGQKRQIITNMALKWQAMGFSTTHLKAFEEVTQNHHRVCDAFGLTIDIFSAEKASTFNNKEIAEKAAYQNTIIPEMDEWVDAWNLHFNTPNRKIKASFDHLAIFSEDMGKKAESMVRITTALDKALLSGAIDVNMYKEILDKYLP